MNGPAFVAALAAGAVGLTGPAAANAVCSAARRARLHHVRRTSAPVGPTAGGRAGSALGSGSSPSLAAIARVADRLASTALARRLAARFSGRAYERRLAFALEAMARQLRSGSALADAVEAAARVAGRPVSGDLQAVATQARLSGMHEALRGWVERRPVAAARLAAAVLAVGFTTGGATADALDGMAAALRERSSAADEARSLTAQARLSAGVLGLAPVAFSVVVSAIDPHVAGFLVTTPAGVILLVSGVVLDVAGVIWMRRLVAGALA